jgi:hypothetical protein
LQGFKGSRVQGFKGSRVQGFKGSRVQGFKGSRVQGFKGSRVQGKEFIQEFTLQEFFMQYCFLSGAMHPALSLGLF